MGVRGGAARSAPGFNSTRALGLYMFSLSNVWRKGSGVRNWLAEHPMWSVSLCEIFCMRKSKGVVIMWLVCVYINLIYCCYYYYNTSLMNWNLLPARHCCKFSTYINWILTTALQVRYHYPHFPGTQNYCVIYLISDNWWSSQDSDLHRV